MDNQYFRQCFSEMSHLQCFGNPNMLHLPKFTAVGMLGFVSRVKRQGTDAQHAIIGREVILPRLGCMT